MSAAQTLAAIAALPPLSDWESLKATYEFAEAERKAYRERVLEPLEDRAGEMQRGILDQCRPVTRAAFYADVAGLESITARLVPGYAAANDQHNRLCLTVDDAVTALLAYPAPDLAALRYKLQVCAETAQELDPDSDLTGQVLRDAERLLPSGNSD